MGVVNDLKYVTNLWFVKRSDVQYVSVLYGVGFAEVGMAANKDWQRVPFTPGSCRYNELRVTGEKAGVYFTQSISCSLPLKLINYPDDILWLTEEQGLCKIELADGRLLLCGSWSNGVRFISELRTDSNEVVLKAEHKSTLMVFLTH